MSKWEICIVWLVIVAVCCVVFVAPRLCVKDTRGKVLYRESDKDYKVPFIDWDFVLQRVILIVLVGIALILPGRRARG